MPRASQAISTKTNKCLLFFVLAIHISFQVGWWLVHTFTKNFINNPAKILRKLLVSNSVDSGIYCFKVSLSLTFITKIVFIAHFMANDGIEILFHSDLAYTPHLILKIEFEKVGNHNSKSTTEVEWHTVAVI